MPSTFTRQLITIRSGKHWIRGETQFWVFIPFLLKEQQSLIKRTLQSLSACLYSLLQSRLMQMVASLLQTVHLHSSQQADAQGKGTSK